MRRLVLGSLVTALVLSATGCAGDDSDTLTRPSTAASSPASESATPTEEPTEEPTETPTAPAIAPATGPLISGPIASVNAPSDWTRKPLDTVYGGNVTGPSIFYNLDLADSETLSDEESVDALAKSAQEGGFIDPPLKRQPDTTVAGQPAYHLAGEDPDFVTWAEEFGFRYRGHLITIVLSTPLELSQSERDAIAAPVLASVKLTG